jgi:diguanylate cyclase (GGDEF)-like protein
MAAAAQVLLFSADNVRLRAWSAALAGGCQVQTQIDHLTEAQPDVVVIDQPLSAAVSAVGEDRLANGEVGVIAVGQEIPADVSLPDDHSPRELRLACLLLAEIVRLRRQRTSARRKEKALTQLALTDPLTELPNRRAWDEHLAAVAAGADPSHCLAIFDLDHFKPLNDEFGHVAGDACLKAVGSRLAAAIRRGDFIARIGGDEFAALLAGIGPAQAGAIVERIRVAAGLPCRDGLPAVTLSAGWAFLSIHGDRSIDATTDASVKQADALLRQAKQAGRNCTLGG